MGTAQSSLLTARFKNGRKDYVMGNHPLWELFRAAYQMTMRPLVLGGLWLLAGYTWAAIRRVERPVSQELVALQRREQMHRLGNFLLRKKAPSEQMVEEHPPCV